MFLSGKIVLAGFKTQSQSDLRSFDGNKLTKCLGSALCFCLQWRRRTAPG